jgi:hypothetical protein
MGGNTPIADVVDAPTIGTATAGTEAATVAYTAAATGGAATSFTAISTPGSITGTGASPITVSGLTGGTAYTFKVYGTNASGVWSGVQSAASNSVTPAVATSFESIATVTTTSSQSSVTFSSIPQTYSFLQVRILSRINSSAWRVGSAITYNGNTSNVYTVHDLYGNNGSVFAAGYAASVGDRPYVWAAANSSPTGTFGASTVDIHNYASTTSNKTTRIFTGIDNNSSAQGSINMASSLFVSTSAITSITFTPNAGTYIAGNVFALYGIKGA